MAVSPPTRPRSFGSISAKTYGFGWVFGGRQFQSIESWPMTWRQRRLARRVTGRKQLRNGETFAGWLEPFLFPVGLFTEFVEHFLLRDAVDSFPFGSGDWYYQSLAVGGFNGLGSAGGFLSEVNPAHVSTVFSEGYRAFSR